MPRRVSLARKAQLDIDDASDYTLIRWGPTQAAEYMRGLFAFMNSLAGMPELGAIVDPALTARRIAYRDYNVYYRIHSDHIEIIRVLHHRRNTSTQLNET